MTMLDELSRLQTELERFRSTGRDPATGGVFPPVNIYDNGEVFLVRAEVPGVDRTALELTAKGNQLVLRGERVVPSAHESASYHRRERDGGRFRRIVKLPDAIDSTKIQAAFRNGVLEVTVPRSAESRPRRIEVG